MRMIEPGRSGLCLTHLAFVDWPGRALGVCSLYRLLDRLLEFSGVYGLAAFYG